jgi:c-di-GMP-binding flagellar brake protein YcgR
MGAKLNPFLWDESRERREPATPPAHPFSLQTPNNQHFLNVPTHAVGVRGNRRNCARAFLRLPLQLTGVNGLELEFPIPLETRDISASGVYFHSPQPIEPGTAIAMEVALTDRPMGMGSVRMSTSARVVRLESEDLRGWYGLAVRFDHYEFRRDESLPPRFR